MQYRYFLIILLTLFVLTSCGGNNNTSNQEGEYEGTKKMVTDILSTDDGKKAITEVLSSDDMQKTYVIDSKIVKTSIEEALSSDKGKEFWTKMFEDPKFVESFAKALQEQHEDVMKGLMSDPEFQKKLIEVLSNPEMEQQITKVLTGQQFREHLQKVMEETFNSPMFKAKMSEIILKAAEEMKPSGGGQSGDGGKQGEGGGQGGGQSEGGGQ
ncbi:spore germination lipoprotein GerD [Gracilibacillus sp. YIM 98692]|uniref:spore germination lipoprotein GerD n=1 Tax=Gracilibacillus sp. YIM 98692 TaxID=2663532 RepID=UPI0013D239C6|nr:spore germination lipoprotein GerD [Gracilibacillus sp. YIM 98692]